VTDEQVDWLTPLRDARANLAMPITRLSERSGISYPTVHATLAGTSLPRLPTLKALVAALLPDDSPEADEIIDRFLTATGQHGNGPAAGSAYYSRLLIDTVRNGLAEIAAAIRDGKSGPDHH